MTTAAGNERSTDRPLARAIRALREWRFQRSLAAPKLLRAFAEAYPDAFFIEIGANDGAGHDHLGATISTGRWRGIMVEPVPYVFERLRANFGAFDRVELENVAIGTTDGTLPFYYLPEPSDSERARLPDWYDMFGSFSREHVLSHRVAIPDISSRIAERATPVLTFDSLCRRHGVEELDLLVIDAEGYDWELLRTIDLERRRPRLIAYEHYYLAQPERDRCRRHVETQGYATMEEGYDTWCLRSGPEDALSRKWARLRPGTPGASAYD